MAGYSYENRPEIWKDIKKYNGHYQISNRGQAKSLKNGRYGIGNERLMKFAKRSGYYTVQLSNITKSNMYVHRLVAEAFVPNPDNKPCVNHIDGDRMNNNDWNLEWCTAKENAQHAWRTGLAKITENHVHPARGKFGINNHLSKKINQYDLKGNLIKTWDSLADAHRGTGFNKSGIATCARGEAKISRGFVWKYIYLLKKSK